MNQNVNGKADSYKPSTYICWVWDL